MKNLILVSSAALLMTFAFGARAAEPAKKETDRKPANSSWVTCTALSTNQNVGKIEVSDGADTTLFTVNGSPAEIVSSSSECGTELHCNISKKYPIKFKFNGAVATVTFNPGKTKLKDSWARGDAAVYEILPVVEIKGEKTKMFGACSRYN